MIILKCDVCGKESEPEDYILILGMSAISGNLGAMIGINRSGRKDKVIPIVNDPDKAHLSSAVCSNDFCQSEIKRMTGATIAVSLNNGQITEIKDSDRGKIN